MVESQASFGNKLNGSQLLHRDTKGNTQGRYTCYTGNAGFTTGPPLEKGLRFMFAETSVTASVATNASYANNSTVVPLRCETSTATLHRV